MSELKFGLIGGGPTSFIGNIHLKAASSTGLGKLAAGCFSRNYETSLAFGRDQGLPRERIYRDYREMAEAEASREDGIDFVIVAAPNHVHYDCCKAFLEQGIHVVCDKPLTHTSAQAQDLADLARQGDLLLAVTYTYSAIPAAARMREIVRSGRLGRLIHVKAEFLSDNLLPPNELLDSGMRWRIDPRQAGPSTCCADIGVHAQHLISYVTGLSMEEVSADMDVTGEDRVLDTSFTASIRYEGGVRGHLWCSNVAAGKKGELNLEVYGELGSIRWSLADPGKVIMTEGEESVCIRLPEGTGQNYWMAFAKIYRNFMEAVMDQKAGQPLHKDFPDGADGIESLRFVEACLKSWAEGEARQRLQDPEGL